MLGFTRLLVPHWEHRRRQLIARPSFTYPGQQLGTLELVWPAHYKCMIRIRPNNAPEIEILDHLPCWPRNAIYYYVLEVLLSIDYWTSDPSRVAHGEMTYSFWEAIFGLRHDSVITPRSQREVGRAYRSDSSRRLSGCSNDLKLEHKWSNGKLTKWGWATNF